MMKILEVRDGFIKFETDENVHLSSFIKIEDNDKVYVAQIQQIKRSGNNSIIYANFVYILDNELLPYDNTNPAINSNIEFFDLENVFNAENISEPLIIGKSFDNKNIITSYDRFSEKTLASISDKNSNNIFVRNISKQLNNINKKVIIIDTLGCISGQKEVASVDFKIPLDTMSLTFLYKDCLNDATSDSKNLIIEIFRDLAEYSRTVPFVPFATLKNIIDEMVDKKHVFKLLVLKNKLSKFSRLNYFANNKSEVDKIESILNSEIAIIDISKLDSAFQNRYLAFIYEKLQDKKDTHVLLELSNVITKSNIKNIYENSNINTTFITHPHFKYINEIKGMFKNYLITPSFDNNSVFKEYSNFLKGMNNTSILVTGNLTNNLTMVSNAIIYNDCIKYNVESPNDTKLDEDDLENLLKESETDKSEDEVVLDEVQNNIEPNEVIDDTLKETISDDNDFSNQEIIKNIDGRTEAVLTEVTKDITTPENLFDTQEADSISDTDEENLDTEENSTIEAEIDNSTDIIEENDEPLLEDAINNYNSIEDISENSPEVEINADYNVINEESNDIIEEELINSKPDTNTAILDESEENIENFTKYEEVIEVDNTENINEQEAPIEINDIEESSDLEELTDYDEDLDETFNEELEEELEEEIDISDINIKSYDETDVENLDNNIESDISDSESLEVLPISEENEDDEFEEIEELDINELGDDDIVVDISDEEEIPISEETEQDIVNDVDKVFTTRKNENIDEEDLDFIDQLNNTEDELIISEEDENDDLLEELPEYNEEDLDSDEIIDTTQLEQAEEEQQVVQDASDDILETRNSSTPMVPVYNAEIPEEDLVISDSIAQGDNVIHAKYGNGVVEKMIKYGNKTLFSINFDNVGRRLLDPTLTEIKKA